MQNSKLKNSIVLREMASNVVDEAIVILKPNIKIKNFQKVKNSKNSKETGGKDFIIKEAENVINEYINKLNEKSSKSKILKLENKIKILRVTNIMFFIILIISILISKLI